jgi:hypothetical protein
LVPYQRSCSVHSACLSDTTPTPTARSATASPCHSGWQHLHVGTKCS